MKIAVTGALGHIGSYIIRELPTFFPNLELFLIDNLATQRYASLFNLPATARYKFVEADVREANLIQLFKGVDVVIHLAAITTAADSFKFPEQIEMHNLAATGAVAQACVEAGIPLLFPSTASVYGPTGPTVAEDCSPEDLNPQSPYATTKLREEALLKQAVAQQPLKYAVLRFGTICGVSPGMRFHTAVNRFCWQAVARQPLTVWQTALDQKRPYLLLEDALQAIKIILDKSLFTGEVYNVVTKNMSVRDITDLIKKYCPDLEIKLVEAAIMNDLSYDVLADKIAAQGLTSVGDMEAGVRATIDLLKQSQSLR